MAYHGEKKSLTICLNIIRNSAAQIGLELYCTRLPLYIQSNSTATDPTQAPFLTSLKCKYIYNSMHI